MRRTDLLIAERVTPDYDLKGKYDLFNRKYFGGELPEIPVSFAPLKSVGGKVVAKIVYDGPKPTPMQIRRGMKKYANARITGMALQLSSLHVRSADDLDGILMHEMIHVYFFHIGALDEQHGARFLRKLRELKITSGIDIPLRDDVKALELADESTKTFGVVLLHKRGGGYSGVLTSAPKLREKLEELKTWGTRFDRGSISAVTFHVVNTPETTKLGMRMPTTRTLPPKGFYKFDDANVKDILDNGREIGRVDR